MLKTSAHAARLLALLGIVLLAALPAVPALAQGAVTLLDVKSNDAAAIRTAGAGGDRVRVTVLLVRTEATTASGSAAEDVGALAGQVRSAVDAVLADRVPAAVAGSVPGAAADGAAPFGLTRAAAHPIFTLNGTVAEIEALAADPRVENITLDRTMTVGLTQSIPLIGMPAARSNALATGAGFAVAIVDTGVQVSHPWFDGLLAGEGCFSGGGNPAISTCPGGVLSTTAAGSGVQCTAFGACNHGTHVAGTAVGRNKAGANPPSGVAIDARLLAYQVFSTSGIAFDSDIISALSDIFLRRNDFGVPVAAVNISIWDGGRTSTGNCDAISVPMKTAIDSLKSAGIATVIIAGNGGRSNVTSFPGCISSAITVSNSTDADAVAASSDLSVKTAVFAPGTNILAPVPTNTFATMTGTSMAAPHVAGAFAALRSACANVAADAAGVDATLDALVRTGVAITDMRIVGGQTKPRIAVDRAAEALCLPVCTLTASGDIDKGESATLSWTSRFADTASIDNGLGSISASSGSVTVTPDATTRYVATFTGQAGSSSCDVTIAVAGPEPKTGAFDPLALLGLSVLALAGRRRKAA